MLPKQASRKVPRSIYEGARDMARQIASSWEGRTSRRLRKKIEMLFAYLKRILALDRLRLRCPNGARDELTLVAIAQNLRKMAKPIPMQTLSRRKGQYSRSAPSALALIHPKRHHAAAPVETNAERTMNPAVDHSCLSGLTPCPRLKNGRLRLQDVARLIAASGSRESGHMHATSSRNALSHT